jgi:hypothetical protein
MYGEYCNSAGGPLTGRQILVKCKSLKIEQFRTACISTTGLDSICYGALWTCNVFYYLKIDIGYLGIGSRSSYYYIIDVHLDHSIHASLSLLEHRQGTISNIPVLRTGKLLDYSKPANRSSSAIPITIIIAILCTVMDVLCSVKALIPQGN